MNTTPTTTIGGTTRFRFKAVSRARAIGFE